MPNSPFPMRPTPTPSSSILYTAPFSSPNQLRPLEVRHCASVRPALLHPLRVYDSKPPLLYLCASALLHCFCTTFHQCPPTLTPICPIWTPPPRQSHIPLSNPTLHLQAQGGLHPALHPALQSALQPTLELMTSTLPPLGVAATPQAVGGQSSFQNFSDLAPVAFDGASTVQDAEAQMEAQLQFALFGEGASGRQGEPQDEPQGGPPPGGSLPTSLRLDDDFANALLAASTGELGGDLASSDEVWKSSQAAGGVADKALDISQASSVGTVVAGDSGPASSLTAPASRAPPLAATPSSG